MTSPATPSRRRRPILGTLLTAAVLPAAVSAAVATAMPAHGTVAPAALPHVHRIHDTRPHNLRTPFGRVRCRLIFVDGTATTACRNGTGLFAV